MPQSLAKIYIHLVFSTKNRHSFLPRDPFGDLHKYARGIFQDLKCHLLEMNNVVDHVHMIFDLHRTVDIAEVVMHVKKGTSRWLKEQSHQFDKFSWQDGYGAFSLGQSQLPAAIEYLCAQQERHRRVSFQDEFRSLLEAYEIDFDERYVWD